LRDSSSFSLLPLLIVWPYTKTPFVALAFIYDPWGTYIELNERPSYQ